MTEFGIVGLAILTVTLLVSYQGFTELDELLDKISHRGFDSLSAREKKELERLSR